MLFKSGVQFELSSEQKKELKEVIGKFPVTIKWCPHKITPSRNPGKRSMPDKPPAGGIVTSWKVTEKNGSSSVFQYAENFDVHPETGRITKYYPVSKEFNGDMTFNENDIEWVWFLWYCYPFFREGRNAKPGASDKDFLMEFHLPAREKAKSIAFDTKLTKAKMLILDPDTGMSDDELRRMLTAYFFPNVESLTIDQVKDALILRIQQGRNDKEKLESIEKFLMLQGNEEAVNMKFIVQKAIDKGMLEYDSKRRTWYMIIEGKRYDPPICQAPINSEPKQYLYEVFTGPGKDTYEMLKITFSPSKGKGKKAKDETDE